MNINIREERPADHNRVEFILIEAFKDDPNGDHNEHLLVKRLRKSECYIPELSLLAELNGKIIGHILLSKINIRDKTKKTTTLSLAPVSVLPEYQNNRIGKQLILRSHQIAEELGYKSIIVLGHADYYPRFGYLTASSFNINLPFSAPDENCMAIELVSEGLKGVSGMVEYPIEFFQ